MDEKMRLGLKPMQYIGIALPKNIIQILDKVARETGITRSEYIRNIIIQDLAKKGLILKGETDED